MAHALGVEDGEGNFITLIEQNKRTPAQETLIFTTDKDNQTEIEVEVYQGTNPIAKNNSHVGTAKISGLRAVPMGELDIKITFEVDSSQEVKVRICEELSGIDKTEVLKLT